MSQLKVDTITDELGTGAPEFPNGNVGIGKSNPSGRLHIDTASTTNRALVVESSTGWGNISTPMVEMSTNSDGKVFKATAATNRSDMNMFEIANANGNVLAIRGTGAVTMPYQPAFHAYGSTPATSGNYLTYQSVNFNIGNHYNSSNGVFTAPITGTYLFGWTAIANNNDTVWRYYFRVNNSNVSSGDLHFRQDTTASGTEYGTNGMFTIIWRLNASDTARIYFFSDNNTAMHGGGGSTNDYPRFWGYLLG